MAENIVSAPLPPRLAAKFMDSMPIGFSYWDEDLNMMYCNRAYLDLFELKDVEEYRKRFRECSPEFQPGGLSSAELGYANIQNALRDGYCEFNWLHQNLKGEPIPTEVSLVRSIDEGKTFLACYVRDMRDVIAKEKKIENSKKQMQFLLDTMPLATVTWSKDLQIIGCSLETVRLFDLNNEQEVLDRFDELIPEYQPNGQKSSHIIQSCLEEAFETGYVHKEWIHNNLKGEPIPCDITLVCGEQDGEPVVLVYILDLRAHYENMTKLRKSEEHTKILLDASPFGTLIWNKDFTLVGGNKAISIMFGLNNAQEFLDNFFSLIPEYQPDGVKSLDRMHKVLQEGLVNGSAETYWVGQDLEGNSIPTEVTLVRVMHNGEYMLAGYIKDLREIEASRKQTQAAEEFTAAVLKGLPLGVSVLDNTFKRLDCNDAIVQLFGLRSKEDFIENGNQRMPEYQPSGAKSIDVHREKLQEAWQKGEITFEITGVHTSGRSVPLEVKLYRTVAAGQDILISYMKDLTEVKAGIQKIQDAEERVSTILAAAPFCINWFNDKGALIGCNQAAWEIFGFKSMQDFIENFQKLFPEFQSDGMRSDVMVRHALGMAMEQGQFRVQASAQTTQGEIVPCDVILKRAVINSEDVVISYVQDLREINAALEKAHTATQAAEKSARAKSEFLANMSHEIRTPMNGILGLLHILSRTGLTSHQQDYLEKASLSANNLLRIINDILDFSKIEAGKLEIEYTPFTLHDICSEIQSLFLPKMREKNLECKLLEGNYATKTIIGDPIRLKQVLMNLVGNAIKFTHEGSVTLSIETKEEGNKLHCVFRICDTGIGLTNEQMETIFSAFSQADTSVTRKYGGTGLGLVISKRIVEMMQGKIWVESTLGKGSVFSFTAVFELPDTTMIQQIAPQDTLTTEYAHGGAHILLVEDNEINQLIASELIQSMGYTLDIANNGQEGIDMLHEKHYDLVLMDIQMPVMDGLTAAKKIRGEEAFATLPVIAMSAHAMVGDKEISLEHGMNDHITKPISPEILQNTLGYWLGKK